MLVHPVVQEAVRRFCPDLVVRYNPNWNRETNRFQVCEKVRFMRLVDERVGLYEEFCWEYPVLGVDQATEIDRRWFQALMENRWDYKRRDPMDVVREESERKRKMVSEMTREWATGPGWHAFKPYAEQFNTSTMTKKDPTRATKERQDRTGRENLL